MELKTAFGFAVIEEAVRQLAERFESMRTEKLHISHRDGTNRGADCKGRSGNSAKLLDDLVEASREPILYNGIQITLTHGMGTEEFSG